MTKLNVNDRIRTPSSRTGVILPPTWTMPMHQFILLDGHDSPIWLLSSILELLEQRPAQPEPAAEPHSVATMPPVVAQLNLFEDAA